MSEYSNGKFFMFSNQLIQFKISANLFARNQTHNYNKLHHSVASYKYKTRLLNVKQMLMNNIKFQIAKRELGTEFKKVIYLHPPYITLKTDNLMHLVKVDSKHSG